jgi:flagellin
MSVINTNVMSLNAQRNLSASQGALTQSIQRLSSGLRVNSARDDAAGLAIATRMDAQVRGMNVAMRNANDGISMAQTAEGALGKVNDMLQRMRELSVQSANASNNGDDRDNLDLEFQALADEIDRTLAGTKFNGNKLFDADAADPTKGFAIQVGANNGDTITVTSADLEGLGNTTIGGDIKTAANANTAITAIDTALDDVNTARATWGASQNRLEAAVSSLQINSENLSAAKGRIMDADFAKETAALTRAQILQQAGTAMLAQANAAPQGVLSLLRG